MNHQSRPDFDDDNVDYDDNVIEQMEHVELDSTPSPLEKIQASLEEYVDICKSIKDVRNEVKLFTERKTELEEEISNFMRTNNVPEFTTSDGKNKIKLYESNTKVPLNKDYLREVAKNKLDEKTLEEIIALAFDRPINNSMKLKLAAPKK
jgi:hypothetical protein